MPYRQWSFESSGGVSFAPVDIYPLSVSADSRWIDKADGTKFNVNGDAAWSLAANVSAADATTYFQDRQAKGVNVVMVNLIEHKFSEQTPKYRNKAGNDPFTGTVSGSPDFTTPNEVYWTHIDFLFTEARKYGILIIAFPAYVGFNQLDEGWAVDIAANGASRMTTYGTFLGNRYKNQPNIIWAMGGDSGPTGTNDLTVHINNLANAIKAVDTDHLMLAHAAPGSLATDSYDQPWLDINSAYPADHIVLHAKVRAGRQRAPAKPTFMIEGTYGNSNGALMNGATTVSEFYQAILGGGFGQVWGDNPNWYFGVNSGASGNAFASTGGLDWHTQLSAHGSQWLPVVKRLQLARALDTLTPDYAHTKITTGYDPDGNEGINYVPCLASSNVLVAFVNGNVSSSFTIDKAAFSAGTYRIRWMNAFDGSLVSQGTIVLGGVGTVLMSAPDGNPQILLLDDQTLSLPNP